MKLFHKNPVFFERWLPLSNNNNNTNFEKLAQMQKISTVHIFFNLPANNNNWLVTLPYPRILMNHVFSYNKNVPDAPFSFVRNFCKLWKSAQNRHIWVFPWQKHQSTTHFNQNLSSLFLDTHVSLAPTHVRVSVGDTFKFPLPLNISVQQSSLMTPPKKVWHPPVK